MKYLFPLNGNPHFRETQVLSVLKVLKQKIKCNCEKTEQMVQGWYPVSLSFMNQTEHGHGVV